MITRSALATYRSGANAPRETLPQKVGKTAARIRTLDAETAAVTLPHLAPRGRWAPQALFKTLQLTHGSDTLKHGCDSSLDQLSVFCTSLNLQCPCLDCCWLCMATARRLHDKLRYKQT